jgi:cellulose biosynthesis protein BcsQ
MALPGGEWLPRKAQSSLATKLISNDIPSNLIENVAHEIRLSGDSRGGTLKLISAYYDLAQPDNRLLIEWLLKCQPRRQITFRNVVRDFIFGSPFKRVDVRYTLAEILHSDSVSQAFDLIIIDCPPRLTTGEIQAFCASTHILVPTIFDRPSAQAVVSICHQIEILKNSEICPYLKYIGVVGSMWQSGHVAQRDARQLIADSLETEKIPTGLLPEVTFVPRSAELVNNADDGIAYIAAPEARQKVRQAIEELAKYVANQMGISAPPKLQTVVPMVGQRGR